MPPFDPLLDIIHSHNIDAWKDRNEKALAALFGTRYHSKAQRTVTLRAPDMRGNTDGIPYAAYIHPANPDSSAYGGMSFVIFPATEDAPCLVTLCIGTQGLAPDETILGRPGHARKLQAITAWLNREYGKGQPVAWAKSDPTRTDIDFPEQLQTLWSTYSRSFKKYGRYLYAVYCPNDNRAATERALKAILDVMFEERGQFPPLTAFKTDADAIRAAWFAHLMPQTTQQQVIDLLQQRRFVIIQGPPGTGKTRLAGRILTGPYHGNGRSIQFHPNTTYENFIGGLAPMASNGDRLNVGLQFAPKPGFLMEAAATAAQDPTRPHLLHIDEINRADLGKVLGEAIYLLEPDAETVRTVDLAYNFGPPHASKLSLPPNLHILGTMNSSDRSIAILDIAVRRRFAFVNLWPSSDVVQSNSDALGNEAFEKLLSIFTEHAPEEALALVPGHSYFLATNDAGTRSKLKSGLAPLLTEYLAQGYVAGFAEPIRAYLQWLESL